MLLDINLWQTITNAFHKVQWMDLWHGFTGFIAATVHAYPIPSLIAVIIIALWVLYRISKAAEKRSIAKARRAKNRKRVREARNKRGHSHRHDHDKRDEDEDEDNHRGRGHSHSSHNRRRNDNLNSWD